MRSLTQFSKNLTDNSTFSLKAKNPTKNLVAIGGTNSHRHKLN